MERFQAGVVHGAAVQFAKKCKLRIREAGYRKRALKRLLQLTGENSQPNSTDAPGIIGMEYAVFGSVGGLGLSEASRGAIRISLSCRHPECPTDGESAKTRSGSGSGISYTKSGPENYFPLQNGSSLTPIEAGRGFSNGKASYLRAFSLIRQKMIWRALRM